VDNGTFKDNGNHSLFCDDFGFGLPASIASELIKFVCEFIYTESSKFFEAFRGLMNSSLSSKLNMRT
jgi:hypothetical protein